MPRGKKLVTESTIASQIEQAVVGAKEDETEVKQSADTVLAEVNDIADNIRTTHARIGKTILEIGSNFFRIKKILDAAPANTRKYGVKTWTNWMNSVAPELCSMSVRTAWHYYQSYAESLASGLEEKTILALAPTLLKSEKPRQTMLTAIRKNPELAEQLNQAARSPKQLQIIAKSESIMAVLEKARQSEELQPAAPRERLVRAIVSTLRPAFPKSQDNFDLMAANAALRDLVYAVREATGQLGLAAFVPVGYVPMTEKDATAMYGTETAQPSSKDVVNAATIGATKALEGKSAAA